MSPGELNSEMRKLARVIENADDPRHAISQVRESIEAIKAQGQKVPAEMVRLEKRLVDECIAASQGR